MKILICYEGSAEGGTKKISGQKFTIISSLTELEIKAEVREIEEFHAKEVRLDGHVIIRSITRLDE